MSAVFSRRPWGRNECVTNEPLRTSAGRLLLATFLSSNCGKLGDFFGKHPLITFRMEFVLPLLFTICDLKSFQPNGFHASLPA